MKCMICGSVAQTWDIAQGGKGVDCVDCGRYDISGSVMAVRAANGYRFDVDQMRLWLIGQRKINPDGVPYIRDGNQCWAL